MKLENLKKKLVPAVAGAGAAVASCVPVFASESAGGSMASVESAMTTSFTEIGTSMTGIIGKILPIALPILGASLVIGFGIKHFKSISKKA